MGGKTEVEVGEQAGGVEVFFLNSESWLALRISGELQQTSSHSLDPHLRRSREKEQALA